MKHTDMDVLTPSSECDDLIVESFSSLRPEEASGLDKTSVLFYVMPWFTTF